MFYFVGLFLGCSALVSTRSLAEPQCSPYDFFERTIEKVVRVEHSNEITADKLKQLESKLDKQWREKEEITSEKLSEIESLKKGLEEFKETMTKSFTDYKAEVEALLERQETDLQNYKDRSQSVQSPIVVFKAKDVTVSSLSNGDVIIFRTIVINEGSGYDSSSGIFTAPVNGLYLFTVQLCLYKNKSVRIRLLANNKIISAGLYRQDNYDPVCYSTDGFAILEKGQRAKVKLSYIESGSIIYADNSRDMFWTSFSGALIQSQN